MAGTWNIGLDLGGCGIRIALRREGIIYDESAVAAFRRGKKEPVALGNAGRELRGREPIGVRTGVMLEGGRVAREELLEMWMSYLMQHCREEGSGRTSVLLAGGPNAREADLQAVRAACLKCGGSEMGVLEAEFAAALGAWFPKDSGTEAGAQADAMDDAAHIVVDIGGFSMFAALIVGGHIVNRESRPFGMQSAVEALRMALRREYAFAVGINGAEDILAKAAETALHIEADGLDIEKEMPVTRRIRPEVVRRCVHPIAEEAAAMAGTMLLHLPDSTAADIMKYGIMLTGGGAQSPLVKEAVEKACGIACRVSDRPSQASIRGIMRVMNAPQRFGELVLEGTE
jgi:rod shape-determining protein MreB